MALCRWRVIKNAHTSYVVADVHHAGRRLTFRLHRVILGAKPGQEVDHINGNGLDNRRENLRLCTRSENLQNRKEWGRKAGSCYKGVYKSGRSRWCVQIAISGKNVTLGTFSTQEEAARAYDSKAAKEYGEFAKLNFERST